MTRVENVMNGAAYWGAYYRYHPEQFVEDYLHIRLKFFQKFLLAVMFWATTFVMIACRGIGKTYLSAIYCVVRCILYPGTRVCVASGKRGQAMNIIEKILYELMPQSEELRAEIDERQTKLNGTNAQIVLRNSSMIKVVTANDNARGNRCNTLLLDECRLIPKDIIDTVLRKFLTLRRMPMYRALTDEERKAEYAKEKNLTLYLTSAYWADSWVYTKCIDTMKAMLDPNRHQFVCGFPYQLSIMEGLLDPEAVADDLSDTNFSSIKFSMEMEALFYGAGDDSFFDFDSVSQNRRIKYPMLPASACKRLPKADVLRIPRKQHGEMRILSADIALMSSKRNRNDATAIFINQLMPSKTGRCVSNIVYADSCEGMRTDDQALVIRRLFDEFQCDYIVLDCAGVGLGTYDALARDIVDPDSGDIYPALSCCNDKTMAERCTVPGAAKVIWSIKANAQFNSDCAILLREGFRSGRVRLLLNEYDAEEALMGVKGYSSLDASEKIIFQMPYIHTTLLIDEMVKLQHEETSGKVRLYERSGMRKDRYSSLSYNYYVATQLENKLSRRINWEAEANDLFAIKAPQTRRERTVSRTGGGNKQPKWF